MRTKPLALALLLLCACAGVPPEPQTGPLDSAWADFGRSGIVEVQIERRLYQQAGNPHFLIRVRVTNRADSVLGVDLRDGWRVLYPNQWGGLPQPERVLIDEEIMEPQALTPELEARLKADYQVNALVMIPVGESTEYFREFNASGRGDVDGTSAPYLFVSIKGQLFVTDGVRVESLLPTADSLYLRTPVAWATVPAAARVVPDQASVSAQPAQGVRDTRMALVPTGIRVQRQAEELAVFWDPSSLEETHLSTDPEMILGTEIACDVLVGDKRLEEFHVETLLSGADFRRSDPIVVLRDLKRFRGAEFTVRARVRVFETSVPVQHLWTPREGRFRTLWEHTLEAQVRPSAPQGSTSTK